MNSDTTRRLKQIGLAAIPVLTLAAYVLDRTGILPQRLRLPSHVRPDSAANSPDVPESGSWVIGRNVSVSGTVERVERGKAVVRIVLSATQAATAQTEFQAVVFERDWPSFSDILGNTDVLTGRTVTVTGALGQYRGRYEVILRRRQQLEIR